MLQAAGGGGALESWRRRLEYQVFHTVAQLRLKHMFDMVVAYPESRPAVEDVRVCLARTNLQAAFVASFRRAIRQRLLHAGALQSFARAPPSKG